MFTGIGIFNTLGCSPAVYYACVLWVLSVFTDISTFDALSRSFDVLWVSSGFTDISIDGRPIGGAYKEC